MIEKQIKTWFRRSILQWNLNKNDRKMPWKGIKDPYKIWLSEIMLQQTRVEQGMGYYNRFIKAFPTVHSLAQSSENQVFKLWEGLGYYSRCSNLIETAKKVSFELGGRFPESREGLLSLKGVGPYTAAAIGSFAFGLPLAVLDGNVMRVLSRVLGIKEPVDQPAVKKKMELLAADLLDEKNPALYNQAIMDFGAVVCKPQQPDCKNCPFQKKCYAFQHGMQAMLPAKSKKIKNRERFLYYLILEHKGKQLVRKRTGNDIWRGLYEFVLMEKDEPQELKTLQNFSNWGLPSVGINKQVVEVSEEIVHQLTHQKIKCQFIHISIDRLINVDGYAWHSKAAIRQFPLPRLLTRYLGW
ncbi:MAG: A/G-specific adenine glycosylase [Bacteroidota bacterium]